MSWFRKTADVAVAQPPRGYRKMVTYVTVTRTDGTQDVSALESSLCEWLGASTDQTGTLTVYHLWEAGIVNGRTPIKSFAPGTWTEWKLGE